MRYNRRSRRRHSMIEDIPLTPLIDTALTLLIIFMITSPMMHNAIKVNLPEGKAKEDAALQQDVIVHIDKDQKLYLNGTSLCLEDLISQISQDIVNKAEGTVYVKADEAVNYGCVIQVVDKLKVTGGVRYVALATKKYA